MRRYLSRPRLGESAKVNGFGQGLTQTPISDPNPDQPIPIGLVRDQDSGLLRLGRSMIDVGDLVGY